MQVVNVHVTTLNRASKFRDHAVHRLQPPKAVCSPSCFLEVCDFFFSFRHDIVAVFYFL